MLLVSELGLLRGRKPVMTGIEKVSVQASLAGTGAGREAGLGAGLVEGLVADLTAGLDGAGLEGDLGAVAGLC